MLSRGFQFSGGRCNARGLQDISSQGELGFGNGSQTFRLWRCGEYGLAEQVRLWWQRARSHGFAHLHLGRERTGKHSSGFLSGEPGGSCRSDLVPLHTQGFVGNAVVLRSNVCHAGLNRIDTTAHLRSFTFTFQRSQLCSQYAVAVGSIHYIAVIRGERFFKFGFPLSAALGVVRLHSLLSSGFFSFGDFGLLRGLNVKNLFAFA